MRAQEGLLTLSELDLATNSMNLYIDNSSLRIFGDELELPNIELGKFYLSRKLIDNSNYKLIFNDFNNFAIEFGDEGILKSIDGKIPTLDSNFKVSFNENRILLNADEVYFDFNILDNFCRTNAVKQY